MKKDFFDAVRNHKLWIDSLGKEGEQIIWEEKVIECIDYANLDVSQSNFIECVLKKIVINHWDFYAATLCSTLFEGVSIVGGEFVKSNLTYVQFHEAVIEDSNFSKADLSNSIIERTEIQNSKFINCLLDGASFTDVHLSNIDFSGAMVENVLFNVTSTFKKLHGLDEAHIKSINIGTIENPVYLTGQEALSWLKKFD